MISRTVITEPIHRIVLAGFMGSGKTTVGRALAERLGWSFADLDDHIATRENCSVPALITTHGEPAFRLVETEALEDLLCRGHHVIALGGGAPETAAVQAALMAHPGTLTIYLDAPFDTLYDRCVAQSGDPAATVRPLLGEREATLARFARRIPSYRAIAHLTVDVSSSTVPEVAEAIFLRLNDRLRTVEHSLL